MDEKGGILKEYRASVSKPTVEFQAVKIDDAIALPGTVQVHVMFVVEVYQTATNGDWWRFDNARLSIR